jgi:hypothetical protein
MWGKKQLYIRNQHDRLPFRNENQGNMWFFNVGVVCTLRVTPPKDYCGVKKLYIRNQHDWLPFGNENQGNI